MKKLLSFKRLEISLIKGFVFGIGFDREFVLFIGPLVIETVPPRKRGGFVGPNPKEL